MATITIDHLYHNGTPEQGRIGDAATILYCSDSHPVPIISRTAKSITVREDSHKIESGTWPDFTYSYSPNPAGEVKTYHWSDKKGWQDKNGGTRLLVGHRRYYQDPTF